MELICTKDYYDQVFQIKKGSSTVGHSEFSEFYKKQLLADHPDMFKLVDGTEKDIVVEEEAPVVITSQNFSKKRATKA